MTSGIADSANAQQVLYGTVIRDAVLIGSYYLADRVCQSGRRVITANGDHSAFHGKAVELR